MTLTIDMLDQIDREAACAPASMLRLRIAQVRAGLASGPDEARDFAAALLLKLEHRLREESVEELSRSGAPAYLAPRLVLIEYEQEAA